MMMELSTNNNCRGCIRLTMSMAGSFYQFNSSEGWTPARVVIDTDLLSKFPKGKVIYGDRRIPAFQEMVDGHEIFEEHIDHVDTRLPIFLGDYTFTEISTGKQELFQLCADGHHRVAKCLKLGIDIPLYKFSEAVMRAVSYTSLTEYMQSKGVYVFGATEEEIESVLWES